MSPTRSSMSKMPLVAGQIVVLMGGATTLSFLNSISSTIILQISHMSWTMRLQHMDDIEKNFYDTIPYVMIKFKKLCILFADYAM